MQREAYIQYTMRISMRSCVALVLFLVYVFYPGYGTGSGLPGFRSAEDSLQTLALRIIEPGNDSMRLENNARFHAFFEEVLQREGSFHFPFDSLTTVSLLNAPDERFRIITWYVPLSLQQFHYFGFIQRGQCDSMPQAVYELSDATRDLCGRTAHELGPGNWYGAYYYEMIHSRYNEHDLYTLLGWKGDNPLTRKRVIEPLHFRDGSPVFGKAVFEGVADDPPWRIVFEYSARVAMSLQYEENIFRTADKLYDMIVFDRLEPRGQHLRGHYQFYIPEANIFDGLYFSNGRWVFAGDVDVRMPERAE